jgi:alkylation response protein AidB-like acyl-CoA dehydrogenase
MDFELSPEQRAFQQAAREFASAEMAPHAQEWDEKHIFPIATLRKAAGLGFGGICVRNDVGGSELTRVDRAIIFEELSAG